MGQIDDAIRVRFCPHTLVSAGVSGTGLLHWFSLAHGQSVFFLKGYFKGNLLRCNFRTPPSPPFLVIYLFLSPPLILLPCHVLLTVSPVCHQSYLPLKSSVRHTLPLKCTVRITRKQEKRNQTSLNQHEISGRRWE